MLVLTRKLNEQIVIGENIVISVQEIGKDRVRIGITAPSDISVHRKEIYDQIYRENIQSSQTMPLEVEKLLKLLKPPRK